MSTAAHIGYLFKIDPVAVLNAPRQEWAIRVACLDVMNDAFEQWRREKGAD